MRRRWALLVGGGVLGLMACRGSDVPAHPRDPSPPVTVPRVDPEPSPTVVSPEPETPPPEPTGPRRDPTQADADARAVARERGLAMLREAKLEALELSEHPNRETRDEGDVYLFEMYDAREPVGWMVVPARAGGDIVVEALDNQLSLKAWQAQRTREQAVRQKVNQLSVVRQFCAWVLATHQRTCITWAEAAPAHDCKADCYWQFYVGSADQYAASRHFTLLYDEKSGQQLVSDMGQRVPLPTWRATQPF